MLAEPPKTLVHDAAKGHLPAELTAMGDWYSMLMRPVTAESPHCPHLKWRVERAVNFLKGLFVKVNNQHSLPMEHDPPAWRSAVALLCNDHVRRSELTPYQHVLVQTQQIPALLTAAMQGGLVLLSAHSSVLYESGRAKKPPGRHESLTSTRPTRLIVA